MIVHTTYCSQLNPISDPIASLDVVGATISLPQEMVVTILKKSPYTETQTENPIVSTLLKHGNLCYQKPK